MKNQTTFSLIAATEKMIAINDKAIANIKRFAKLDGLYSIATIALIAISIIYGMLYPNIFVGIACGSAFLAVLIWIVYLHRAMKSIIKDMRNLPTSVDGLLNDPCEIDEKKVLEIKEKISQGIVDVDMLTGIMNNYAAFEPLDQKFIEKLISITHQSEMSELMELSMKILIMYESNRVKLKIA